MPRRTGRRTLWVLGVAVLGILATASSWACTCMPPPADEGESFRQQWQHAQAVVIAEGERETSEPETAWLSRDHVLGRSSPLRRRPLLQLVVRHHWKGQLAVGDRFLVYMDNAAACGYPAWRQSGLHLLYLNRAGHWAASLCSDSQPIRDLQEAVRTQEAQIQRLVSQPGAR